MRAQVPMAFGMSLSPSCRAAIHRRKTCEARNGPSVSWRCDRVVGRLDNRNREGAVSGSRTRPAILRARRVSLSRGSRPRAAGWKRRAAVWRYPWSGCACAVLRPGAHAFLSLDRIGGDPGLRAVPFAKQAEMSCRIAAQGTAALTAPFLARCQCHMPIANCAISRGDDFRIRTSRAYLSTRTATPSSTELPLRSAGGGGTGLARRRTSRCCGARCAKAAKN